MSETIQGNDSVSVLDLDRLGLSDLVRRVVSDPEFRGLFQADAREAIRVSGAVLSPAVADTLVRNASLCADLTADMDKVASSFYFFFYYQN